MKMLKKLFVFAMVMLLSMTSLAVQIPGDGSVVDVQAATLKINKTAATLAVGQSVKLKVTGTKKSVKWSSSKKSVAKVSDTGKVTAKKAGTAVITAKAGSKKVQCTISVVTSNLVANITYSLHQTDTGVVAIMHNGNSVGVKMETEMIFKNASGGIISTYDDFNYGFESGRDCIQYFQAPRDSQYNVLDYNACYLSVSASALTDATPVYSKYVEYNSNISGNYVYIQAQNNGTAPIGFVHFTVVFYDGAGNVIGSTESYASCNDPGSSDVEELNFPENRYYQILTPSSYKVYLDWAYGY